MIEAGFVVACSILDYLRMAPAMMHQIKTLVDVVRYPLILDQIVGVANALKRMINISFSRAVQLEGSNGKRFTGLKGHGGTCLHDCPQTILMREFVCRGFKTYKTTTKYQLCQTRKTNSRFAFPAKY
jgi:hypothetical protein